MAHALAAATTFLFVPGNRPERFAKAHAAGADVVIIDLEDAVKPEEKDAARAHAVDWLAHHAHTPNLPPTVVRLNARATPEFDADVRALAGCARAVMLPKVEAPEDIHAARQVLGADVALIALIESARGVCRVQAIAQTAAPLRLAFGNMDFAASIGVDGNDERALLLARSHIVLASAAAGITAPIDGVTTVIDDAAATEAAAQRGRALGFGAKLCIHPAQIVAVQRAYQPNPAEAAWAQRVVAATQDGNAARVDGAMVDAPVLARARQILALVQHGSLAAMIPPGRGTAGLR